MSHSVSVNKVLLHVLLGVIFTCIILPFLPHVTTDKVTRLVFCFGINFHFPLKHDQTVYVVSCVALMLRASVWQHIPPGMDPISRRKRVWILISL